MNQKGLDKIDLGQPIGLGLALLLSIELTKDKCNNVDTANSLLEGDYASGQKNLKKTYLVDLTRGFPS